MFYGLFLDGSFVFYVFVVYVVFFGDLIFNYIILLNVLFLNVFFRILVIIDNYNYREVIIFGLLFGELFGSVSVWCGIFEIVVVYVV